MDKYPCAHCQQLHFNLLVTNNFFQMSLTCFQLLPYGGGLRNYFPESLRPDSYPRVRRESRVFQINFWIARAHALSLILLFRNTRQTLQICFASWWVEHRLTHFLYITQWLLKKHATEHFSSGSKKLNSDILNLFTVSWNMKTSWQILFNIWWDYSR